MQLHVYVPMPSVQAPPFWQGARAQSSMLISQFAPVKPAKPSPPSPLTPEIMQAITRITGEMWPGVPVVPVMSTGATDSLYFRQAGIPIYGVSGLFGDMDDVRSHGRDERMGVKEFYDGQEFLWRLVVQLSGAKPSTP